MKKIIGTIVILLLVNNILGQNETRKKEALLILNGKIISKEIIDKIDPKIVDSVKILKEKPSIEKYGEKGKFGTIEIYASRYATENVEQNQKIIYVLGGIASTYTKEDLEFEKKYNIKYHDFGCVAPINFEEFEAKNKIVFDYLKKTHGSNWTQKIKTSAMGFEKWKKT